ncbi:hypothetical protein BV20DRAFT_181214 [Pilatotrama ljubarskyi]|nr:hypothetical protein BV20DRAFT_181214 [Pilatotrama ljubarskyi]
MELSRRIIGIWSCMLVPARQICLRSPGSRCGLSIAFAMKPAISCGSCMTLALSSTASQLVVMPSFWTMPLQPETNRIRTQSPSRKG